MISLIYFESCVGILNIFIYNNNLTEQSIRQMHTTISYLDYDRLYLDLKWKGVIDNITSIDFMYFDDFINMNGIKVVIFFNIIDGYYLRKYKNKTGIFFVFRPRGILPEESYYKNENVLKKIILNYIERKVISLTDYFIFLNNLQRNHFILKHKVLDNNLVNSCVLPNIKIIDETKITPNDNDIELKLVYSGGFSKWQKIDLVFKVASSLILNSEISTVFTVLTFKENFEKAKELADHYKIKDKTIIKYIPPNILDEELSKHDIGIIIRDNSIVNMTASPFKIVDYISSGLALIVTETITSELKEWLNEEHYFKLKYNNENLSYSKEELTKFAQIIYNEKPKAKIIDNYIKSISNIRKINLKNIVELFIT